MDFGVDKIESGNTDSLRLVNRKFTRYIAPLRRTFEIFTPWT